MRIPLWTLLLAIAGCGESCTGCGPDRADKAGDNQGQPPERAVERHTPAVFEPDGGVRGVTSPELGPHYQQREDGPELEALKAAKATLEQPRPARETLTPQADLIRTLPASLGEFQAEGDAAEGPKLALGEPIHAAKRTYTSGAQRAVVKVTDTSQSPGLLIPVSQRLTSRGGQAVGNEAGVMLDKTPAIESYYPKHKNSRITAVVDGQLLVEIRIAGAQDQHAARELFQQLRFH